MVRTEILFGRTFVVVDAVLLVEGVHHGSGGPLLYTADDLAASVHAWNGRPVVVLHPHDGLSANRPEALETQQVGTTFKANFEKGKLTAELWLELARLQSSPEGLAILATINAGGTMEVSTGLFTANQPVDGEFRGKRYEFIARHHQPDHLAILPGMKGACSVSDGCGLQVRNQHAHAGV